MHQISHVAKFGKGLFHQEGGVISRLVAVARPLFADKGASDVSLREVATADHIVTSGPIERVSIAAGVNYGLIHHHVGTKGHLLRIALQRSSAEWTDYFVNVPTVDDAVSTIMRPSRPSMPAWSRNRFDQQ